MYLNGGLPSKSSFFDPVQLNYYWPAQGWTGHVGFHKNGEAGRMCKTRKKTRLKKLQNMGNVTAGGVNDGEDDENEYYEVLFYVSSAIC